MKLTRGQPLMLPTEPQPITQTPVPYSELQAALAAFERRGEAIYGMRHDSGHWVLQHGPLPPGTAPEWPGTSTTPAWLKAIMREYLFPTK